MFFSHVVLALREKKKGHFRELLTHESPEALNDFVFLLLVCGRTYMFTRLEQAESVGGKSS